MPTGPRTRPPVGRGRPAGRRLAGAGRGRRRGFDPGHEGDAARVYFEAFPAMVRQNRDAFRLNGRTRRPPLDA